MSAGLPKSSSARSAGRRVSGVPSPGATSRSRTRRASSACGAVSSPYTSSAVRTTAPRSPPAASYAVSVRARPLRWRQVSSSACDISGSPPGASSTSSRRRAVRARSTIRPAAAAGRTIASRSSVTAHRPGEQGGVLQRGGEAGVFGAAAEEVGPHRDDDPQPAVRRRWRRARRSMKASRSGRVAAEGVQLLELVDDQPGVGVRAWDGLQPVGVRAQRVRARGEDPYGRGGGASSSDGLRGAQPGDEPGAQQGGLAAAGGAEDSGEAVLAVQLGRAAPRAGRGRRTARRRPVRTGSGPGRAAGRSSSAAASAASSSDASRQRRSHSARSPPQAFT